ncbi:adenine phosphoribosyltransferase [Calidifontibacter sp. DB0510]|uniref:Adenine phosphoribosyltransferase n=1 Tax=Metallococcus carri TaxID=1656884 RepID=A0A967B2U4_9MICO|nr:adenine phosphoribosyltransferase [Metallococcus carri]NHN56992.1 adenine phosphoribosyltransferase [Metallococcus carri]NOP37737.1 adenine phosphoribosyltransferase [Calidifontibacter sp. DB2511S]
MSAEVLLAHVREVPDFPEPGVLFKDLNPLFADPTAFGAVLDEIAGRWNGQLDLVAGIEARGFIVGAPLAQRLDVGFLPIRKAGKLPGPTRTASYDLEYGTATIEIPADSCADSPRVLLVDDVLATGGTAAAAAGLLAEAGAQVVAFEVLLEIGALGGRTALSGYRVSAVATV